MDEKKILSMMGLSARAGRLCSGHDEVIDTVVKNKAKLVIIASDSSDRLKKEAKHACSYGGKNIPVIVLGSVMADVSKATGRKAGIFSVTDENFANGIIDLCRGDRS